MAGLTTEGWCGVSGRPTNWAGNVVYRADRVHRPGTLDELQELVSRSRAVRALGSGHSFNRIADSAGVLVSTAGLPPVMDLDPDQATVTVSGGIRYGELARRLHAEGHALHNLASLPHISIAGTCATATHGSGNANGNLATAVAAVEMVTADGEVTILRRDADADHFRAAVVGLGGFGIVTRMTLDIIPAFSVRQYVYEDLPAEQLTAHFEEIFASAYSVSVFTRWLGPSHSMLWLKRRVGEHDSPAPQAHWMGARLADQPRHPIAGEPTRYATQQLGVPGPWHERLPHFRLDFTPSSGAEIQTEYLLPRQMAAEALDAMAGLGERLAPVLQISEIRTVAADDLWMSPSYHRDTVALHFTWINDFAAVTPVVTAMEERLAPLGARPHWGKLFTMPAAAVTALYVRSADFAALLRQDDPGGKFRNDFINQYFPAAP
jgi:alditol oxidase